MARLSRPGSIEHARAVRASRAQTIENLRLGKVGLRDLLSEPPGRLPGLSIWDLLLATPRMGPATARAVCERARLWPLLKVASLTKHQRRCLLDELPERIK